MTHTHRQRRSTSVLYGVTIAQSASSFLAGQLSLLADKGNVALVFGVDGADSAAAIDERVAQYQVPVRRNPSPIADLAGLFHLIRLFRELRPAVAVMGTPKMAFLGLFAAMLCRVPRRVYVLNGLRLEGSTGAKRVILWLFERTTMACASEVLSVSESLRTSAVRMRLVKAEKIGTVGEGSISGVDLSRFHPPSPMEREQARSRFDMHESAPIVGVLGRVTPDKGLEYLPQVWRRVLEVCPDAQLVVAGADETTPRGQGHLVEALEALPGVELVGRVSDPEQFLAAIDVLVLLTRREGFGMVLLEAAACGLPVVATEVSGTRDAVIGDLTGAFVDWGNAQAAAAAIIRYLTDPELRQTHGVAGRERALREFDAPIVNQRWVERLLDNTAGVK